MTTSGVSLRKSCGELSGPRPVGDAVLGPDQRDRAVGDLPAVQALPQRLGDVLLHGGGEGLHVLVDVKRYGLVADLEPEPDARARGGRVDADSERGEERVLRRVQDFLRGAGADRTFDADRGGFPEADLDPVFGGKGGLDDLFLDL